MSTQVNIFLLLFGVLQGVLLSLFLIRKKTYRTGYIFLVLYLFVLILQIVLKVMDKLWLMQNMTNLYSISYRLPYLYGPLVYLLTIHLQRPDIKFSAKHLLHFLPFILTAGVIITDWYRAPLNYILYDDRSASFFQLVSISVYHILSLHLWRRHSHSIKNQFSNISRYQVRWLRKFIALSMIFCLAITVAMFFMYVYHPALHNVRFAFILLAVFIYWISFSAMNQPELFAVIHGKGNSATAAPPKLVIHRPQQKYINSGLKTDEVDRILDTLHELMVTTKPYLNAELTIDQLADQVPCSRHHLSQVMNNHLHQSFYDYINLHRVEEAKMLLTDPRNQNFKIASIAYDAGFNSLSTFNDVFRKLAGQTPSQFRRLPKDDSKKQRV